MTASFDMKRKASAPRRIAAGVIALVGVVFIVSAITNNLFQVGPDFEAMIDDFRPMLAVESTDAARADLAMLEAVGTEFDTGIVPALSQQLGMTPDEFLAFTAANYPAVAEGVAALPTIVPTFNGLVDTLDSQRELFESADAIPTKDLPATTVPWGIFIAGLALIAAAAVLYKPGWLGLAVTGGLGLLLIGTPLVLSLIPKSNDADELNDNLRPIYTPELIAQAKVALTTVGAMGTQMQTEMLPGLGEQLGMTEAELNGFLAQNFPATATALQSLPDAMGRFQTLTTTFEENLDNYETVEPVALAPISWTLLIGGVVAFLASGAAWVLDPAGRRGRFGGSEPVTTPVDLRKVTTRHDPLVGTNTSSDGSRDREQAKV